MIKFSKHSGIHMLEVEQVFPTSIKSAWEFFSNPGNLEKITPPWMGFVITSENTGKAYPGQIITYRVGILPLVRINWVTEITQVKEHEYFIDEQRFGPYKMWHHEHRFKQVEDGVLMTDRVSYKIPYGFVGSLMHPLFIKQQLKNIFTYRHNFLTIHFNM